MEQNFPFTCQSQGKEAEFKLTFKIQLECQVLRQFPLLSWADGFNLDKF